MTTSVVLRKHFDMLLQITVSLYMYIRAAVDNDAKVLYNFIFSLIIPDKYYK